MKTKELQPTFHSSRSWLGISGFQVGLYVEREEELEGMNVQIIN